MPRLRRLSVRATLVIVIGSMALLLIGLSAVTVFEAQRQHSGAVRIKMLAQSSHDLSDTLVNARNERGNTINALSEPGPVTADVEQFGASVTRDGDIGFAKAMTSLAALDEPVWASLAAELRGRHDAVVAMRPAAEKELHKVRAERDPALLREFPGVGQAYLNALITTADQVEASIKLVDPIVDHLLSVKRALWLARVNLGVSSLQLQALSLAGKTATPDDVIAWMQNQARAAVAWSLVTEAVARPDAPKPLVDAVKAAETNFTGDVAAQRKALLNALATGASLPMPPREYQSQDLRGLTLVVTAANAALDQMVERADVQASASQRAEISAAVILVGALLLSAVGFSIVSHRVSRPMRTMTGAMLQLAGGDTAVSIPGVGRRDEIGAMASAVQVFKDGAIRARALEKEQAAAASSRAAEDDQIRRQAEQTTANEAAALVVGSIGLALERLSEGDLTYRLDARLPFAYEKLEQDLNTTIERLQKLVRHIVINTSAISMGTGQLANASNDMSRRTETQAASLEQTAAALDEITTTVRKMAEGATQVHKVVSTTRADALQSGKVVEQAIAAMGSIEKSSQEIGQIIGVIDEIAFQTNLLALNAGVEAARAGDAGRGFAVVASEVRALAQRSAQAAREIKALISTSAREVDSGVKLVGETGSALARIVVQVSEITTAVSEIAASAQEQAAGLQEVNTAINAMDQVTQQNAAMVEQSTSACQSLALETAELVKLTERFQIGDTATVPTRQTPKPVRNASQPKPHISKSLPLKVVAGGRALAGQRQAAPTQAENWEEF